ncbi:tRNA (adenosine(37)-N6)-threonylcarbamoyltransferase complex dimerization subunit type 1 TsaB [Candidatus Saccharibacteria bacterium]|nr:tRNA (adenosine(37)-N6)-threonylcarbamoyltransferase complex dimerization subunit type 1 TsaB [Candidatus Saccharibacteria bacterium]
MKMYLDTANFEAILRLDEKEYRFNEGREMAEKLLGFIREKLEENGKEFKDISEITFFSGPGSFTGLRIGAAIVNTLADQLKIPLYNHKGERVKIIIPDYGRAANISKPKK